MEKKTITEDELLECFKTMDTLIEQARKANEGRSYEEKFDEYVDYITSNDVNKIGEDDK